MNPSHEKIGFGADLAPRNRASLAVEPLSSFPFILPTHGLCSTAQVRRWSEQTAFITRWWKRISILFLRSITYITSTLFQALHIRTTTIFVQINHKIAHYHIILPNSFYFTDYFSGCSHHKECMCHYQISGKHSYACRAPIFFSQTHRKKTNIASIDRRLQ